MEGADANKCIPSDGLPQLLKLARPAQDFVKVDFSLPGCPPPTKVISGLLTNLLEGRKPENNSQDQVRIGAAMKRITIEPVSRIEGHAKITIQLDDAGNVADTQFQVTQVRGFEKFTEGRPFYEMPGITSRICGICPISHQLASSKACDAIMAVRIPRAAQLLREIVHCAQFVQSHALSFFYLSGPTCCWAWMPIQQPATLPA